MAEAVLRRLVEEAGLAGRVEVGGVPGPGREAVGEAPDRRAVRALVRRGYPPPVATARQFRPAWFQEQDLVLALDSGHASELRAMAPDADAAARVHLLRSFDGGAAGDLDVPDPYYSGRAAFDRCLADRDHPGAASSRPSAGSWDPRDRGAGGPAPRFAGRLQARPARRRLDLPRLRAAGLEDGRRVFAKRLEGAHPELFSAEKELRWLAGAGSVPFPEVLDAGPDMLVLTWVPGGEPTPAAAERLGRELALLYRCGAPRLGAPWPGFAGPIVLDNAAGEDWPSFFAGTRIPLPAAGPGSGRPDRL